MTELIANSVTKDDYLKQPREGMPLSVVIGPSYLGSMLGESGLLAGVKGATGLPSRGTWARDAILSESLYLSNMWASAVALAISKQTALGFTIDDPEESPQRIKRCQEMLLNLGGSWHSGLPKHLRDYLLTSNGAYLEIVRASSAAGSRILGLMPLDSLRCYPTDDPDYPVVYADRFGGWHRLDAENVIRVVDMPSSRQDDRGYGMCAADRAWETVLKVCAMETYFREKVSGARNLAIHIVNGISDKQLSDALSTGESSANARGFVVYRGSTIIPMLRQEAPAVVTIPLAEIPDGFNVNDERKDAYLQFANALGVPVQDIQPLSGQGLGTGTQSIVLQEAAQGQGLAAWRAAFARAITHRVMPNVVTFAWSINDVTQQRQIEEVEKMRADRVIALLNAEIITADQARNILVDSKSLPPEFIAADATAGGSVSDQGKVLLSSDMPDPLVTSGVQAMVERRQAAQQSKESPDKGILGYHIEQGIVTRNEARAALGLPPESESSGERLRRLQASLSVAKAAVDAGFDLPTAIRLVGMDDDPIFAADLQATIDKASQPAPIAVKEVFVPSSTALAPDEDLDALIDAELDDAVAWARLAMGRK